MSATYDNTLATDRDWVRRLIGDTSVTSPAALFQDEEIDAVLAELAATTVSVPVALKYFAAAQMVDMLHTKSAGSGAFVGGLMAKRVGDLARSWGVSASTSAALDERARELRRHGARLLTPNRFHGLKSLSVAFAVLAASGLSVPSSDAQSFFWIQFPPPVATSAALPACTDGSIYENRTILTKSPAPGSFYQCPDGGGSWSCIVGADCPSTGSVTSVAMTVPSGFSVTGSPITGSGTLAVSLAGPITTNVTGNVSGTSTDVVCTNCLGGTEIDESSLAISTDPTLVGDVDGLGSANDLDEVAVEAELEAVLDLSDQQGAVTDTQVPNNITIDSATSASDLACTNCIGGTEIDESTLVLSGGDVTGPASSVDDEVAIFSGTTGKIIKRAASSTSSISKMHSTIVQAAGAQFLNSMVMVSHQGFSGAGVYDNPTAVLNGSSVPDVRGGSGSIIGGTVQLYLGCMMFTSSVNAVNSHNVMLCNEYDGELGIGSPNAAFDPRAFSTGGLKTGVVTKTADYALTADDYTLRCDATSGAVNFTLPTIAAQTRRRIYRLIKVDSSGNACTFTRSSSDTINGATTATTSTQYVSIEVQSPDTGSDWMKF